MGLSLLPGDSSSCSSCQLREGSRQCGPFPFSLCTEVPAETWSRGGAEPGQSQSCVRVLRAQASLPVTPT